MESDLPPDYQTIVNGTTNEPKINEIQQIPITIIQPPTPMQRISSNNVGFKRKRNVKTNLSLFLSVSLAIVLVAIIIFIILYFTIIKKRR